METEIGEGGAEGGDGDVGKKESGRESETGAGMVARCGCILME
jgi:hypothetical protein